MKLQQPDLRRIYHNLEVVPSNYQTRGMHTIIRDVQTNKTDFVFYADRLLRLVCAKMKPVDLGRWQLLHKAVRRVYVSCACCSAALGA